MNAPLKHTIIAMATAALGFTAACGSEEPAAEEASSGGETATEASCAGATDPAADPAAADPAADPAAAAPAEGGGEAEAACG